MSAGSPRRISVAIVLALGLVSARPDAARADEEERGWQTAALTRIDALNLRLEGYLENDTAFRIYDPHGLQKSQLRLELAVEARPTESLRFWARGRMIYDPPGRLVAEVSADQKPIPRGQIDGSRRAEVELRELYLDWRGRIDPVRFDLRVGKQQIVWGQAFGVRVLDAVNAFDFREFILDDFLDARIPVFGARLDAFARGWSFQLFALPDFEPDLLPSPESEFQFNLLGTGAVPTPGTFGVTNVIPEFALIDVTGPDQPDDWRLSSTAFGLRIGRFWKGWDLFLHYLDAYDPSVTLRRRVELIPDPDLGLVIPLSVYTPTHERIHAPGFAVSTTRGDFGIWAEGILAFGRSFALDDLGEKGAEEMFVRLPTTKDGLVRRTDLRTVAGLDWTGQPNLFAGFQWIQAVVFDYDRRIIQRQWQNFVSLLLRYTLLDETVIPQLFVLYGIEDVESMIRPSLEWKATDHLALQVGADLFTGPRAGLLGQFANRLVCNDVGGACLPPIAEGKPSRVFLRLRYSFGWSL